MHIRGRTLTSKRSNTLRFGHARLRESVRTLHVFSVVHFAPISVSLLLRRISGATQTLREQSGREWRSLHIEAQLRNDLGIRKILPTALSLTENTFRRWLKRLAEEAVLKLEKQEGDCAVSAPPPEEREKARRKQNQRRFTVSSEVRNRASQAFWAMPVEAPNWSGMGLCTYAAAMQLSRTRSANGAIDWTPRRTLSDKTRRCFKDNRRTGQCSHECRAMAGMEDGR